MVLTNSAIVNEYFYRIVHYHIGASSSPIHTGDVPGSRRSLAQHQGDGISARAWGTALARLCPRGAGICATGTPKALVRLRASGQPTPVWKAHRRNDTAPGCLSLTRRRAPPGASSQDHELEDSSPLLKKDAAVFWLAAEDPVPSLSKAKPDAFSLCKRPSALD